MADDPLLPGVAEPIPTQPTASALERLTASMTTSARSRRRRAGAANDGDSTAMRSPGCALGGCTRSGATVRIEPEPLVRSSRKEAGEAHEADPTCSSSVD